MRTTARYPATRMGIEDVIHQAFLEAKQYQQDWRDYEARVKRGEQATPPRRDLKLEPMVEVLEGKRMTHVHAYRGRRDAHDNAPGRGARASRSTRLSTAWKATDNKEIVAHGAGVSTFSDWWAYKMEAIDAIPYNAALMTRRACWCRSTPTT